LTGAGVFSKTGYGSGTLISTAGVISSLAGTTTTILHGNAAGAPTFGAVVSADMNITTTTCTNQFVTAISAGGVGTCTTDTLASAQHANQGTTTTVLHGNAAGNPSWAAVSLTADITGVLAGVNGGTGLSTAAIGDIIYASATTPTWSRLAAVASGSILASAGTNTAPAWSTGPTITGTMTAASFAVSQTSNGNVSAGNFRNASNGTAALVTFTLGNDTNASAALVGMAGSGYTNLLILQNRLFFDASSTTSGIVLNTESTIPIVMAYNNAEVCRFQAGLSCGSTTDPGSGIINALNGYKSGGTAGTSVTYTVRDAGGAADCTIITTGGIVTGGTC
jgi:hypothetical protein